MKGIDILIKDLAMFECPSNYGLTNFKHVKDTVSELDNACLYGDGSEHNICVECFKLSLNEEYIDVFSEIHKVDLDNVFRS